MSLGALFVFRNYYYMAFKRFKVKIKPTTLQVELLEKSFGCSRFIWNQMLAERNSIYQELKENKEELYKYKYKTEKQYKEEYPWLGEVSFYLLQQSGIDLVKAFQSTFKRLKKGKKPGFPNFKKKSGKQSFRLPNVRNEIRLLSDTEIKLPKMGAVKLSYLPKNFVGKIKSVTLSKRRDSYHVSILTEVNIEDIKKERTNNKTVGLDFGLKEFITTSSGEQYTGIKANLYLIDEKIGKLQRHLVRKKRGSNRYKKLKDKLNKLYEYKTNFSDHYQWHLVNHLCSENQTIIVEDLNIDGMKRVRSLSRSVSTQSWSSFLNKLKNKSVEYDTGVYKIDRFFPSSKMCSRCGIIKQDLTLSDRTYKCSCGHTEDRDINAAKNIRKFYFVNNKLKSEDCDDYKYGEVIRPVKLFFNNLTGSFDEVFNLALAK